MSPHQFRDVNIFPFIYSRTGLHPLKVSLLNLQLPVFKMDLNQTPVSIIKVIATMGLSCGFALEHLVPYVSETQKTASLHL